MQVCYNKLWKILIDKGMNQSDLRNKARISFNVLAKMRKGEAISMESLYKVCRRLEYNIGDIIEFLDKDENSF